MARKLIKKTLSVLTEKRLSTVVGAWVFYFLTAIIPLVFLLITFLGVFGVEITNDLVSRLPLEFRNAGEVIVLTAKRASSGATLLFIVTSGYACVRLLNQMSKDGDYIYMAKSTKKRGLMRRVWALLSLCALFVVFLFSSIIVAFGGKIFVFSSLFVGAKKLINAIIVTTLIIGISFVIIVLLNFFISPLKMRFKEVAFGSLFSLFAIVLGTLFFAIYIRVFNSYNAFYGSLAGIVVFLLWVYILMMGMVVGVIINAYIYQCTSRNKNPLDKSR